MTKNQAPKVPKGRWDGQANEYSTPDSDAARWMKGYEAQQKGKQGVKPSSTKKGGSTLALLCVMIMLFSMIVRR